MSKVDGMNERKHCTSVKGKEKSFFLLFAQSKKKYDQRETLLAFLFFPWDFFIIFS
jgi:hypothetical protein